MFEINGTMLNGSSIIENLLLDPKFIKIVQRLPFYDDSGKHMLSAAILNYENCSSIQKMYQTFSVYRVYWLSVSIEKNYINQVNL